MLSVAIVELVENVVFVMQDRSPILVVLPNICIGLLIIAPPGIKLVQPLSFFIFHSFPISLYFDVDFQSSLGDICIFDNSFLFFIQNTSDMLAIIFAMNYFSSSLYPCVGAIIISD